MGESGCQKSLNSTEQRAVRGPMERELAIVFKDFVRTCMNRKSVNMVPGNLIRRLSFD